MAKRKARQRTQKKTRKSTSRPAARARAPRRKIAKKKKTAKRAVKRKPAAAKARRPQPRAAARPKRAAAPKTASRPKPLALSRPRRSLADEPVGASVPSTLGFMPKASGAESGNEMYNQRRRQHSSEDSKLTGGDVDADWGGAYASGEETPGGDMPTPDQDVVEEIGRALGVEYEDAEELKGSEKISDRDRHRWEYDPASAEDYQDRNKKS